MAELVAVRESVAAFSEVGAYTGVQVVLTGGDEPFRVFGARVTADLLDVWGVRPELRALTARLAEEHPETNAGWTGRVMTLRENLASSGERTLVYMLGLTVTLVLGAVALTAAWMPALMRPGVSPRSLDTAGSP